MLKYIKTILFLLFAIAFYSIANHLPAEKTADGSMYAMIQANTPEQESVSSVQMPYLPDAELGGAGLTHFHQITMSRIQRINISEYIISLKSMAEGVAGREDALSQHWSRLYGTTTSYACHPVSEYYVFALRRIIV